MMLVTVIPKRTSTGKRTTQPSMNSVATVDINLRRAQKAAAAAAAAAAQIADMVGYRDIGRHKTRNENKHKITHTQAVCFSRS